MVQRGDVRCLHDLAVVLAQRRHSETQRHKDSCEVIDSGIFLSGGRSIPLDVGKPWDYELVGEDDTKYGRVSTTASEEERWATTLSNMGLGRGSRVNGGAETRQSPQTRSEV